MSALHSISRRLVASVLLIESAAAVALVFAVAFHEHRLQLAAVDASLRGNTASLMGAVQDADDEADNLVLETRGLHLPRHAIYRVEEQSGRVLGSSGVAPMLQPSSTHAVTNIRVGDQQYRFLVLQGVRVVDPGNSTGGITHHITITYGEPLGHVWHEVFEAIRSFVLVTVLLLAFTAALLILLMRRALQPLHDLAAGASAISATNWDFTPPPSALQTAELAPLADALSQAIARLQISFTQQRRLTSDAAHELKTDVAIVKSSLQLLAMKTRTEEEYRTGLSKAIDDFGRLEQTLRAMLTLARLEQHTPDAISPCLLRDAVEESLTQCRSYAAMQHVELKALLTDQSLVPIERADAILLSSNLLMNAIQHSPAGHTVVVSLATGPASTTQLKIADSGDGIAEQDLPFVLDAFYRGDPSRSRTTGGTGLGLSICKAICDQAGGSFQIESTQGKGTTVIVNLPCVAAHCE